MFDLTGSRPAPEQCLVGPRIEEKAHGLDLPLHHPVPFGARCDADTWLVRDKIINGTGVSVVDEDLHHLTRSIIGPKLCMERMNDAAPSWTSIGLLKLTPSSISPRRASKSLAPRASRNLRTIDAGSVSAAFNQARASSARLKARVANFSPGDDWFIMGGIGTPSGNRNANLRTPAA